VWYNDVASTVKGHKPTRAVASANAAAFLCYNLVKKGAVYEYKFVKIEFKKISGRPTEDY